MFHHGYCGSLLVKQWQQATQAWQRVGQFCYRCVISSPWKMNTFGKLLVKTMSTVFKQVNLFFNGNRQLIRAYGFHTCLICGRHVCFWYLYRDRRKWGIRVKQCDISWSGPHWTKINHYNVGRLTSETCFGNWNKLIPVQWSEPRAVVEDGSWSRSSIAPTVNKLLCKARGKTTPTELKWSQTDVPKLFMMSSTLW